MMTSPTIAPGPRRRLPGWLLPVVPLLALAAACFASLAAEPTGLIVDGRRPSVDYANRGDLRPIGNDLTFLFLPHHEAIARRIARFGHWPTWDARGFGGRPLVGNPQAGMAYPPAWLAWWLRTPSTLGWLTVAHLIGGGMGAFVLLRSTGARRWSATAAGGIYQASPYLMAHTFEGHYPHVWAACWYPWAFWAYRGHRDGQLRGLMLAPFLALTYLTGHPQEWLLLVLALSAWAVADGVREWRSGGARRSFARIAAWLGLLALSIGMAGVDLVPQVFARPWLLRAKAPAIDAGAPRRYHLSGFNAFQLLSPTALGGPADYFGDDNYWESVLSIGLVPLVLAVIAATRHPDRRLVRGWIVLTVVAVAFAGGRALGLYPLCRAVIPGAGLIRVPARSLFLANLAAAVLAGLGLETLRMRMAGAKAWRRLAWRLGAIGVVAIGLLLLVQRGRRVDQPAHPSASIGEPASPPTRPAAGRSARAAARVLAEPQFWWAFGTMTGLMIVGCCPIGTRGRRGLVALVGLLAPGELAWSGFSLIRVAPARQFVGPDPVSATLAGLSSDAGGRRPPPRIKARDAFYGDLPAALHGIEKTNVDDAFQLDRASALYETLYPVASRVRPLARSLQGPATREAWRQIRQAVFDRMGVEFLVSDRVEADPAWPVATEGEWQGSRFVIQRNPGAMPRAYVVPRASVAPDRAEAVPSALRSLNPRDAVVMPADPLEGTSPGFRQPFTAAEWTSSDPDRPALIVTTRAPGLLVVADSWTPGWTATVDSRPAPVLLGNYAQRVIPLPEPGRHAIRMHYHPPGLVLGIAISSASALAWMILLAGRRARYISTRPGSPALLRGSHHGLLPGTIAGNPGGAASDLPGRGLTMTRWRHPTGLPRRARAIEDEEGFE